FEDIVQGKAAEPPHVAECQTCRDGLAERRAVRERLQLAFASVHASPALAARIGRSLAESRPAVPEASFRGPRSPSRIHRLSRRTWATLAAVAAVLVLAIPALMYFGAPNSAVAAQTELVRIHERNLVAEHEFYSDADPAKIAEYLKTRLGFEPATPRLGQGRAMRGCCVAHFKGQAVGSYVVETPRGPISIIVVRQTPEELGIDHPFQDNGKTFWADTFAKNHMVAVRLGGYSYCAVGEVPRDLLTSILLDLGLGN
ncbi:MAG: hypothetical protein IMZ69_01905, partial [Spirochaetes bacterium]|nr:hypothetical protein [Spirochaetota bacterium]